MKQCKFKVAWRSYGVGDLADLKDKRAAELAAEGTVDVLGDPPDVPAAVEGTLEQVNAELRQKLAAAEDQCRQWKAKYEAVDGWPDGPAEDAASDAQPDAAAPQAAEGPAPDPASLFPELSLPEGVKRKLAAAGWKTTEDVKQAAAAEGGLAAVRGISKVVAQQVTEELAKLAS